MVGSNSFYAKFFAHLQDQQHYIMQLSDCTNRISRNNARTLKLKLTFLTFMYDLCYFARSILFTNSLWTLIAS